MARPRKAPEARHDVWLNLRVTPTEADAAYQRAMREGRPLAELLREAFRDLFTPDSFRNTKTANATARRARALS
jgi:hypothetical protein